MAEGEGTEQDRLVREKDKEWAEQIILPELWEYLARASQQVSDFKFTHGQVKDNSLFMKQPQHQLQMAIDSLVDSGLVLKPQDSKRNPQYTVNRERAVAEFPPQAAPDDDDDDAGVTEGETPSPTKKRRAGGGVGGGKHPQHQQLPRKLKKKKKKLIKQLGSAEGDVDGDGDGDEDDEEDDWDDEDNGGFRGGDEAPDRPPQPPPPPMPQGPAPPPVPEAVLSAVMEALPGDGNEMSKAVILASMSQQGIEAADVEAVLEFLEAKNKIMTDGDDIYVM